MIRQYIIFLFRVLCVKPEDLWSDKKKNPSGKGNRPKAIDFLHLKW